MSDTLYAVKSGFFDAINHDRLYSADDMNQPYKEILTEGIDAGGFEVTPQGTPNMTVNAAAGHAFLGGKWVDAAAKTLTVPENTTLYGRIDAVVLRVDINSDVRAANLIYRTGTPADTPEAPALIGTTGIYEVRLANIVVAASATAIAAAQITDKRGGTDCPYADIKLGQLVREQQIADDVSSWLTEHVNPVGSAVVVDDSLSIAGAAADAKATGDALTDLNNDLNNFLYDDIPNGFINCLTGGAVYETERVAGLSDSYYGTNEQISIPKGSYVLLLSPLDLGFSLVSGQDSSGVVLKAWAKEPYLSTEDMNAYAQMRLESREALPDSEMSRTFLVVVDDLTQIRELIRKYADTTETVELDCDEGFVVDYFVDLNNSIINQVPSVTTKTLCLPCRSNCQYVVRKTADTVFRVGYAKTNSITVGTALYGIIQNSTGDTITIVTGNDAAMLCIYYYSDTASTLSESALRSSISVSTISAVDIVSRGLVTKLQSEMNYGEKLLKVFALPTVPAQNGSDSNQLVNLRNTSVSELYSVLQTIIDNSNGYITKTVCGKDSSNTYEVWRLSLKNNPFVDAPRKVLIDANVHCGAGDAIDACFTMIWLCKFLSEEYRTNEVARYIRNNYDFEIIPLANPWGFANNSCGNANGVNINRNYDYNFVPNMSFNFNTTSGPSAFSEVETQYIRDMLLDNLDAYFWMDLHSYGDGVGKKAFYVQSGDSAHPYNAERARRVFAHTQNMIDGVEVKWYGNFDSNGWGPAYGAKTLGIWSPNLECGNTLYGSLDTYSSGALTSDFYDLIGFLMFE